MGYRIEQGTYQSIDPRTGEVIAAFSATSSENVMVVAEKARVAFRDWSGLSLKTRAELISKAYRQFHQDQDEIATLISRETGKPLAEAYSSEILPVLDCFQYYLRNIRKFLRTTHIGFSNPLFKIRKGYVLWEPLGVVAVISPWNYPFLLSMMHIIPALLTGNAVIHKPSEHTSLTGLKIRDIFDRAYLPRNVLAVVTGLSEVGQAVVQAPLDKVFFTGSTAVGRKIYQAAAENLCPVNMELGGSDAMIVLEDADIERAVRAATWGAFTNCGQACVSVERLFVHESIREDFINALKEKIAKVRLPEEGSESHDVSCLAVEQQFTKIRELVADASDKGAEILTGGRVRREIGDLFFEPTVLTNVDSSMKVTNEEIFGPVLLVMSFTSEDEAVFLANESPYGLSASIWTHDLKRGERMARKIAAGSVLVNDLNIHVAQVEAPYAGYKNSGIGVSQGRWEIMELVKPKYVNTERPVLRRLLKLVFRRLYTNDLWWFSYSSRFVSDMRVFNDFLHHRSWLRRLRMVPATLRALFRKDYL